MCVCVCVCVSTPKAINNYLREMKLIALGIDNIVGHGLSNKVHHERLLRNTMVHDTVLAVHFIVGGV